MTVRGEKLKCSCSFLFLARATTNTRKATAQAGQAGEICRPRRASTEMARKLALRRQAGGRDRQRRDGGDDRSGDVGKSSARRHAATVANYVVARPAEEAIAKRLRKRLPASPRSRLCAGRTSSCRCTFIGFRGANRPRCGRKSSSLRKPRLAQSSTPLSISTRDTILGTSGCASSRTGTCSPQCARARRRSSMARLKPSRDGPMPQFWPGDRSRHHCHGDRT